MNKIFRIARIELSLLFYSPIAWFILIIFFFQSGLVFTDSIKFWVQNQESIGNFIAFMHGGLTHLIFNYPYQGFFPKVQSTLYLYIPIITMGLISREISSGSIKLLLSSPLKIRQIVLGKFLSMMLYGLLFILILLLYVLAGRISIHSMDFAVTISGLLATYLLICFYSGIGIFMSSLTSYQVVAAISTLAVFAALQYIGDIGQNISIIRSITYFLSQRRQTTNLNNGLITSTDVFYFLNITVLFLCLTTMKLNNGRELRSGIVKAGRYTVLILVFLLLGYISSKPVFAIYYDVTANKSQTLSASSQRIMKALPLNLKVTAYVNLLDDHAEIGLPENRNKDREFWARYIRFMPKMQLNYCYYYDTSDFYNFGLKDNIGLTKDQIAKKTAESYGYNMDMFLTPSEMAKRLNLVKEDHRFIRQLEVGNKKTFLRVFHDPENGGQPFEHEIIAAFKRLVVNPPKIVFLTGNRERGIFNQDPEQYKLFANTPAKRESLINQGFDVDTLSLANKELPEETTALVIADPKTKFNAIEQKKLNQYIATGGNMFIAADTGTQEILGPLLESLGVKLMPDHLVQNNKGFGPEHIRASFSNVVGNYFDTNQLKKPGRDSLEKVIMNGVVGLEYQNDKGFKIEPILVVDRSITGSKPVNDNKKLITTALILTRKINNRNQRILITGDADFMSNQYWVWGNNINTVTEMFKWLDDGEFPVDTNINPSDINFIIKRDDVSIMKWIFLGIIPCILLIYSSILLLRRRAK